jgi:micrococcal nuclease
LAATVVEVVDGDTVVVRVGRTTETVRLIGVDTPETVKPDHPVECFGPEASAWLRSLLPAGSPVTLLGDDERRDVYGRMLAYVLSANPAVAAHSGLVNLAIVAGGYGRALVIAPNDAFASHFRSAAAWARDRGLGLWGACPPQPAVSR